MATHNGAQDAARNLWSTSLNTLTHGHGELSKVPLALPSRADAHLFGARLNSGVSLVPNSLRRKVFRITQRRARHLVSHLLT